MWRVRGITTLFFDKNSILPNMPTIMNYELQKPPPCAKNAFPAGERWSIGGSNADAVACAPALPHVCRTYAIKRLTFGHANNYEL